MGECEGEGEGEGEGDCVPRVRVMVLARGRLLESLVTICCCLFMVKRLSLFFSLSSEDNNSSLDLLWSCARGGGESLWWLVEGVVGLETLGVLGVLVGLVSFFIIAPRLDPESVRRSCGRECEGVVPGVAGGAIIEATLLCNAIT